MDINEDIFRLLLIVLLIANDRSEDGGVFCGINQVIIAALLLGSSNIDTNRCRRDDDDDRRRFI